jgi:hypothetical protein
MKAKARSLKRILMGPSFLLDLLSCGLLPVGVMVDVSRDPTLLVSNKVVQPRSSRSKKVSLAWKRFCPLALPFIHQVAALDGVDCGDTEPKRVFT